MPETEKSVTKRNVTRSKQTTTKTSAALAAQQGTRLPRLSVSFQVRTPPPIKAFAERLAEDHSMGGRSKLDAEIYKRGLWITALLLGPGPDGSYAGVSERDLARHLAPLFDRHYGILDRHHLLPSYVYRVLPPGGLAFLQADGAIPIAHAGNGQQPSGEQDEQSHYQLSGDAQTSLKNFAEEI